MSNSGGRRRKPAAPAVAFFLTLAAANGAGLLSSCAQPNAPGAPSNPTSVGTPNGTSRPEVRTGTLVTLKGGREVVRAAYRDDGVTLVSELTLPDRTASVRTSRPARKVEVDDGPAHVERDIPPGTISLENGDWQAYAIAAEWYADARDPTPVQVLVPGQGALVEGTIAVTTKPSGERHVALTLGPLAIAVDVGADGRVIGGRVPLQELEVRSLDVPSPSAAARASTPTVTPVASAPRAGEPALSGTVTARPAGSGTTPLYGAPSLPHERDIDRHGVEVRQGDHVLAGELMVPKTAARPLPLVVIVPGSGPTDRNGNSTLGLSTDAYLQLAELAARRGVATLRYDKRGIGQSRGYREEEATLEAFARDLVLLVEETRRKDHFSSLVLAGHSEGGIVALKALGESRASALVLLAAPGRPLDRVLREQLVQKGLPAAEVDAALASARQGRQVKTERKELGLIFRPSVVPYFKTVASVDPCDLLRNTTVPTTIVQGDNDRQISVDDAKLLQAARPDARLVVVHDMAHTLKIDRGTTSPQRSYTDPSVAPADEVVNALVEAARR